MRVTERSEGDIQEVECRIKCETKAIVRDDTGPCSWRWKARRWSRLPAFSGGLATAFRTGCTATGTAASTSCSPENTLDARRSCRRHAKRNWWLGLKRVRRKATASVHCGGKMSCGFSRGNSA